MSDYWTLRWLAMVILFALSTFAFSSYASADIEPAAPEEPALCPVHGEE